MHFLVLVSTPILAILLVLKIFRRTFDGLPPGPPSLPIIGNLHQLISGSPPHVTMWKLSNTYGPDLMTIRMGGIRTIVVSSARMAREVLKTHDVAFSGRPSHAATRVLSYDCSDIVWAPYGQYWRELRKICTLQLLSSKKVQTFAFVREEEVSRLITDVSSQCSAAPKQPLNLTHLIHSYANNVVFRVAFRKRFDDRHHGSRLRDMCEHIQEAFLAFSFEDHFPALAWVDRLTGVRRLVHKAFHETYSFIEEVMEEHRCGAKSSGVEEDITDVLIRLKDLGSTTITRDNQIKTILADVLVAGTETTSATLVWVMAELMRNPVIMRKAREEVRLVVGAKDENTLVNEEDIRNLPYMKAVIKETFRLDPVTPLMVPRQVIQKCSIDGYELPPGLDVCVNVWAIGRDPDTWYCPEEFCPERFLNKQLDYKGEDFGLLPFGAGRRSCPGMMLGTATIELALANLLYWFDWELPLGMAIDDISMESSTGIVAQKKAPLCLTASKYTPSPTSKVGKD